MWVMSQRESPRSHVSFWTIRHFTHIHDSFARHVNESYHTYECVMSHLWRRQVTHIKNDMSKMSGQGGGGNQVLQKSHGTHECVMSHIWISHSTHIKGVWTKWRRQSSAIKESRHAYGWVMSHVWMSHVTHIKDVWTGSHVTHMNASCHTYEWVTSHISKVFGQGGGGNQVL